MEGDAIMPITLEVYDSSSGSWIEVHGSVYGEDLENLSEEISRRIVRRLRVMS